MVEIHMDIDGFYEVSMDMDEHGEIIRIRPDGDSTRGTVLCLHLGPYKAKIQCLIDAIAEARDNDGYAVVPSILGRHD